MKISRNRLRKIMKEELGLNVAEAEETAAEAGGYDLKNVEGAIEKMQTLLRTQIATIDDVPEVSQFIGAVLNLISTLNPNDWTDSEKSRGYLVLSRELRDMSRMTSSKSDKPDVPAQDSPAGAPPPAAATPIQPATAAKSTRPRRPV